MRPEPMVNVVKAPPRRKPLRRRRGGKAELTSRPGRPPLCHARRLGARRYKVKSAALERARDCQSECSDSQRIVHLAVMASFAPRPSASHTDPANELVSGHVPARPGLARAPSTLFRPPKPSCLRRTRAASAREILKDRGDLSDS